MTLCYSKSLNTRSERICTIWCKSVPTLLAMQSPPCDLYDKTRVKRATERAALYVYAVFLRISSKSDDLTRVLPYKTSFRRNCIFSRVLPVKSQHWCQNRPENGPPNLTPIALNTRFVEVIRVCMHKNTGFYRVKWLRNRPKWPTQKMSIDYAILPEKTRVK